MDFKLPDTEDLAVDKLVIKLGPVPSKRGAFVEDPPEDNLNVADMFTDANPPAQTLFEIWRR